MEIASPTSTIDAPQGEAPMANTPPVGRRTRIASAAVSTLAALMLIVCSLVAAPATATAASWCKGYYYLSQFSLKDKDGNKSSNYHIDLYKKEGTNSYAIEVRPQQHVSSKRTFYGSVTRLYPNGSKGTKKSDRGYGDGGTDCLTFTMTKEGERFELYGSTAKKKGAKRSHWRTITVWRNDDGDVKYAG